MVQYLGTPDRLFAAGVFACGCDTCGSYLRGRSVDTYSGNLARLGRDNVELERHTLQVK